MEAGTATNDATLLGFAASADIARRVDAFILSSCQYCLDEARVEVPRVAIMNEDERSSVSVVRRTASVEWTGKKGSPLLFTNKF